MSLWTIVPVKPFSEGKSRLAGCISPQKRHALNRELLTRTLAAIHLAHIDAQIVVVSRDRNALAVAEEAGSHGLAEESQLCASPPAVRRGPATDDLPPASCSRVETEPESQLNAALTQAARYAVARGATKLLILPTDMPNLTAEDVRAMASPAAADRRSSLPPAVMAAPMRLCCSRARQYPSLRSGQLPAPPASGRGGGHPRPGCRVGLAALRRRPAGRLPAGLQLQ